MRLSLRQDLLVMTPPHTAEQLPAQEHLIFARNAPDDASADFRGTLPWKVRLMLRLTQCVMILRHKSWGKWIIIPTIALALLLALPLGLFFLCYLVTRSLLRSFRR